MPSSAERRLRVLHVVPMYGADLCNGSEYHNRMLATRLVRRGLAVDVFTTCSSRLTSTSPLVFRWDQAYPPGCADDEGVRVTRFPARLNLPAATARTLSAAVRARWRLEERRQGSLLTDSAILPDYLERRARSRPALFDRLFLRCLGPWSPELIARVRTVLPQYDLVLTGHLPFSLPVQVAALAGRRRTPVILLALFHPEDVFHHQRVFYDCFSAVDAILAQTAHSAALFRRLAPGANPVEVGAGVDSAAFLEPRVSGARFRARHGLGDRRLVLCVGRKEYGKRYDLVVDAVERLADEQVRLVLIGEDIDRKPIFSPRVSYLGRLPRAELIDAYDAADVFVAPSAHESFGMVFLEAWMRRKPVIGNAGCGPVASLIREGVDGFLCRNSEEIALRIRTLLDEPELARQLGEHGQRKAMTCYTWDAVAGKVADLYSILAARHRMMPSAGGQEDRESVAKNRGNLYSI